MLLIEGVLLALLYFMLSASFRLLLWLHDVSLFADGFRANVTSPIFLLACAQCRRSGRGLALGAMELPQPKSAAGEPPSKRRRAAAEEAPGQRPAVGVVPSSGIHAATTAGMSSALLDIGGPHQMIGGPLMQMKSHLETTSVSAMTQTTYTQSVAVPSGISTGPQTSSSTRSLFTCSTTCSSTTSQQRWQPHSWPPSSGSRPAFGEAGRATYQEPPWH